MHGGTVRVESAGRDHGAEFIVLLPLPDAAPAPDPRVTPGARPNEGRRVLVVDDNRDAAESLADITRMLGSTRASTRTFARPADLEELTMLLGNAS